MVFLSACDDISNLLNSCKKTSVLQVKEIEGPLLAQVNDWRIGLGDFEKRLQFLDALAKQQNLDVNDYEFKKQILDELVRTVLLAEEAKSRGLDNEQDIVEAVDNYKQTLLAQRLLGEAIKNISVTDVEIENFYEQNKNYFKSPEQIKIREIAVDTNNQAKDLYIQILQGADFSTLASQYSVLPSKSQAGDLGYISYDPEKKFQRFWEVALTLGNGEISNIFSSDDEKYYILQLEDKKVGKTTSLNEIENDIRKILKADKENKEIERLVDSTKQKATVVINNDLLQ